MNNEEKILAILEQMQGQMDRMDGRMDRMDGRMERVEGRMDKMEAKQEETQATIADMQTTLTRVAVTQENIVLPQLKLLAEGHENVLNNLIPKSRVENLEAEVVVLRTAIKSLAHDVEELKSAR